MRATDQDELPEALVAVESFRWLHLSEQYWVRHRLGTCCPTRTNKQPAGEL